MTEELIVPPEDQGQRLDRWLAQRRPDLSRARIQTLLREGHITVENRSAKPSLRITPGLRIRLVLPPPRPSTLEPEPIPLDIRFEDDALLVLNKPAGLVVHPAAGHPRGTLVHALLHHCPALLGIGGEQRPGLVHRLDRDTSGLMVVAKTESALRSLQNQFKKREVQKVYLALAAGRPAPPSGRIETPIGRASWDRKKMSATPARGKPAVTLYETVKSFPDWTLLRLRIETGRTHQIRVHLAHLGHPVAGDPLYARRHPPPLPFPIARQMLHAAELAFRHPETGQWLHFQASPPPDMQRLIEALEKAASPPTDPLPRPPPAQP